MANLHGMSDKRVSGTGYGITMIVLGVLLAVLGVAVGAWMLVPLSVPFVVLGAVTFARRHESREVRIDRNEKYQRSTRGLVFAAAVAVGFWVWAIVGAAPRVV